MITNVARKPRQSTSCRLLLAVSLSWLAMLPAQAAENEEQHAQPAEQLVWITADGQTLQPENLSDAAAIYNLRSGLRTGPLFSRACAGPLDLIGNLSTHPFWTEVLPLSPTQSQAITKLDDLVQEADTLSLYADADYPANDFASYEAYLARSRERREAAIHHAQRMVDLGLLTEPQAAFVLQRWMTTRRRSRVMYNERVQQLLGMTESQVQELAHICENYRDEKVSPALWEMLTIPQREMWVQLTAERTLPAEPPNLPSSQLLDAEDIDLAELSPTFRVLLAPPPFYARPSYQGRLLRDLEEVTRDGLLWISLRDPGANDADAIAQARNEFLMHAEQVALLGILTEAQAERGRAELEEN
jgi:hypothetical protein